MVSRRRVMMAPLAMAGMGMIGAAPRLALAQDTATPTAAEPITIGPDATIDVTGTGEASGEATGAILQFILRPNYNVAPVPDEQGAVVQPAVTADQVNAVLDALKKGGVPDDAVVSAIASETFVSSSVGPGSAVVAAQLDEKLLAKADRIISRAGKAGTDAGALLDPVSVAYVLPDCGAVEQQSLQNAVADGQAQARALASALGVTLGGLVKVSKQLSYGGYYAGGGGGAGGPSSASCQEQPKLNDALTSYFNPYDPNKRGEVEIYTTILMTFSIA